MEGLSRFDVAVHDEVAVVVVESDLIPSDPIRRSWWSRDCATIPPLPS